MGSAPARRNAAALLPLAALLVAGCLPGRPGTRSASFKAGATGMSAAASSSSGAAGQCAAYDAGNPTRAICVDCYSSVLSSRCPGKSSPSACADPAVARDFAKLVNSCIASSIVAGFVCSKACLATQVLNASTCSCEDSASSGGPSAGGAGATDSGQFDFGPPILTLKPSALATVDAALATPATSLSSCSLPFTSATHGLIVRNRGGTVPRSNIYAPPAEVSAALNGLGTGNAYLSNVGNITPVSGQAQMNATIGFTLSGGAQAEAPGLRAATASSFTTFAGLSFTLSSATINVPGGTAANWGATAADSVGFGARDGVGNVYFVDPTAALEIKVVCYASPGIPGHPCNGLAFANVGRVFEATPTGTAAAARGLAVDGFGNIYYSTGGSDIRVYCWAAGYYCGGGDVGSEISLDARSGNYAFAGSIDGFDLEGDGSSLNVYYADTAGNRIRAACDFASAAGTVCATTGAKMVIDSATAISGATLSAPRSVAIHPTTKSLYVSDSGRHRIVAQCYNADGSGNDPCGATAAGTNGVIAGTAGSSGDSGDGGSASSALVSNPQQLVFAKTTAEDVGSSGTFRDNNLVFAEGFVPATSTAAASGSTVRVICGQNSAQAGFCSGMSRGVILRVAGIPGNRGSGSNNSTASVSASAVSFADPIGLAYDRFKNLVVGSGASTVSGDTTIDNGLRLVQTSVVSGTPAAPLAIRYTAQDSNGQISHWCLRFHLMTSCSATRCSCTIIAPLDPTTDALTGVGATESCL